MQVVAVVYSPSAVVAEARMRIIPIVVVVFGAGFDVVLAERRGILD